jgi:hypothetical protein
MPVDDESAFIWWVEDAADAADNLPRVSCLILVPVEILGV